MREPGPGRVGHPRGPRKVTHEVLFFRLSFLLSYPLISTTFYGWRGLTLTNDELPLVLGPITCHLGLIRGLVYTGETNPHKKWGNLLNKLVLGQVSNLTSLGKGKVKNGETGVIL